jgi:hypothetical protein
MFNKVAWSERSCWPWCGILMKQRFHREALTGS